MKRLTITCTIAVVTAFVCEAQITSKYVLDRMIAAQKDLESAHFRMTTSSVGVDDRQVTNIWFDAENTLTQTEGMDVLVTPELLVTANHRMALLQFVRLTTPLANKNIAHPTTLLDSLFRIGKQPVLIAQNEQEFVLLMEGVNDVVREVEVNVDARNFQTSSIELRFHQGPYGPMPNTLIEFEFLERNPDISPRTFAIDRFFLEVDGKRQGVGRYADYEIQEVPITQLN